MATKSSDAGYGSIAILIHWVSAILILVLIGSGFRSGFSDDTAAKLAILKVHIPVAILVLLLTIARLIWWWKADKKPAPLGTSPAWQEGIATWIHRALYLLVFVLLGSGISLSIISDVPDAVFGTAALPELQDYAPRQVHGIAARVMAGLVALHGLAALYHHFGKRDRTLRRMWFGAAK
ncbi:MAG TPA: cytochrome b [Roseibacterium sp.]|nr:cytochrome b [Roseibacterium sp.]